MNLSIFQVPVSRLIDFGIRISEVTAILESIPTFQIFDQGLVFLWEEAGVSLMFPRDISIAFNLSFYKGEGVLGEISGEKLSELRELRETWLSFAAYENSFPAHHHKEIL
jgi:hypothetical protein